MSPRFLNEQKLNSHKTKKIRSFTLWFIASNYFPSNPFRFRLFNVIIYDRSSGKFSLMDLTKMSAKKNQISVGFQFSKLHSFWWEYFVKRGRRTFWIVASADVLAYCEEKKKTLNKKIERWWWCASKEKQCADVFYLKSNFLHEFHLRWLWDAFGQIENHLINCEQWKWKLIWFPVCFITCSITVIFPHIVVFLLLEVDITMRYCNQSLNRILNLQKWI